MEQEKRSYAFGPFSLDTSERVLRRDGTIVPLTPKAFDTLYLLIANSGRVLEKEEMLKRLWPDSFVEEATLAQNIFTLRKSLGESPNKPQFIETVPKRGYRFVAQVTVRSGEMPQRAAVEHAARTVARSIAVLPFRLLTSDGSNEYFGLGMADALITRLSNIEEIVVRPTSAVLKYDSVAQDPVAAGKELSVEMVLGGIIQRINDRIRVTVQLIKVETGAPLWASKFDEIFTDIFAVEDIISEQVLKALTVKLTSTERELVTKHYTKNSKAYEYYLKGRYLWNKWRTDGFKKSIEYFERAIEAAPGYALAYAGLADAYNALAFYGYIRPHDAMPQVKMMAEKALQLDSTLVEARIPLAASLMFYYWDWPAAEREFQTALELNSGHAMAHQGYSMFLIAMGRFEEAKERLKRAQEIDPVSPLINTTVGFPYFFAGEYDEAAKQYKKTLEEDPNFGLAHAALGDVYIEQKRYDEAIEEYKKVGPLREREVSVLPSLGFAYAVSGDTDAALDALKQLLELSLAHYVSPIAIATIYLGLGDRAKTLEWLEKAYKERTTRLAFLKVQPNFAPLRSDPDFMDILRRIGFSQ